MNREQSGESSGPSEQPPKGADGPAEDDPPLAIGDLFEQIRDELHAIAQAHMARQNAGHTLQATALVNEAYLKLCARTSATPPPISRAHFVNLAAQAMRHILVDHARQKLTSKRAPPGARVDLDLLVDDLQARAPNVDLLWLDEALERLAARDPELCRIVELRYFGGWNNAEAAQLLGVSETTARRRYQLAEMLLKHELGR